MLFIVQSSRMSLGYPTTIEDDDSPAFRVSPISWSSASFAREEISPQLRCPALELAKLTAKDKFHPELALEDPLEDPWRNTTNPVGSLPCP
jgi:hypothetical protein